MTSKNCIALSLICLLLFACSSVKTLPKDEKLYTGASINVTGPDLTSKERKTLRNDLRGLTSPKPNSRILGLPIKLYIYNLFGKAKENSFAGKLRNRLGEPPVLLSQLDLTTNVQRLQTHLENKGFFNAKVSGDTVVKNRKGSARYTAETGNQYHINDVSFEQDSSDLTQAIGKTKAQTLLKKGKPYDLDVIRGERTRIDAYLKEHGFYYFSPDYLLVKVDSTIGNHQVNMRVTVKPDIPTAAREIHRIDNIYIYSNYSLNTADVDTNRAHQKLYKGYFVVDKENKYKPYLFEQTMQFDSGDVYNRTDHNQSLNRLMNLNLYKFVRNRFEPTTSVDTPKLDVYYYLTPLPKKSLRAEIGASTKSNSLTGSQITFSFRNRNTFRAGELLNISAYIGSEVQSGGRQRGYNTFRTGSEVNLTIPRFVIPFFNVRTRGGFVPRTNIQLGYDVLNKRRLYTLNSFRGGLGYLWKENIQKQHEFYPISINYVQPLNITEEYTTLADKSPTLRKAIERQFILGSNYSYNFSQVVTGIQRPNSFYFNGVADVSGNIAGLLTGANVKEGNEVKLFRAPFSQYVRLETDGRYYRKIGLHSTWANRVIVGYGLPYGNSLELPFIKQFFVGGTNSVRAFRSRSVGPGTYNDTTLNILPDQTGDIKLEFNTEFRPKISGPIYGAIFLDAGNVWLKNKNPEKPGGEISKDFLKELAVGAGIGLRVDITMFVLRLDVAFPLRKPWEADGKRWVTKEIDFADRDWRRENLIWNLAIGYPF